MVSTATLQKWIDEGDPETEASAAEYELVTLTREFETLAKGVETAEWTLAHWRYELGLKLLEMKQLVHTAGKDWTKWFPANVRIVSLRTAQRYMELATQSPPSEQPEETPNDNLTCPAEASVSAKKSKRVADETVSAKVTIGRLVKRLDEDRAAALLVKVREWIDADDRD